MDSDYSRTAPIRRPEPQQTVIINKGIKTESAVFEELANVIKNSRDQAHLETKITNFVSKHVDDADSQKLISTLTALGTQYLNKKQTNLAEELKNHLRIISPQDEERIRKQIALNKNETVANKPSIARENIQKPMKKIEEEEQSRGDKIIPKEEVQGDLKKIEGRPEPSKLSKQIEGKAVKEGIAKGITSRITIQGLKRREKEK